MDSNNLKVISETIKNKINNLNRFFLLLTIKSLKKYSRKPKAIESNLNKTILLTSDPQSSWFAKKNLIRNIRIIKNKDAIIKFFFFKLKKNDIIIKNKGKII